MSLISISEASDLTGKSIPIIYRHIKEGKLTQTDNSIDTTELIRLFGAFKTSTDYHRENDLLHRSNADLKQDKEKLYQINELLRHSNADLKQDKEKLYRIIATQQKWLPEEAAVQIKSAEMKPKKIVVEPHNTVVEPYNIAVEPYKIVDQSLIQRLIRKIFFN